MGEAGHNAGFPLFSKPARGKTAKQLRKITKDLVETTKDLGKTIRHLVFPGCYLALWQALWRVTKRAIKRPFHIVYIKVLGVHQKGHSAALLSDAGWGMYLSKRLGALSEPPCSLPLLTPPQGCSQNHHSDTPLIRNYTIRLSMTSSRLPGRRSITGTSIIV